MKKLERKELGDVIAVRDPKEEFKRETNIQQYIHTSDDFEWGYGGAGPTDFALNILLHFTHGDEPLSCKIAREFRDKYVATLPRQGGTIPRSTIEAFIEEKKKVLSADPAFQDYVQNFERTAGHKPMKGWGE